jgi:hypothetical protein
MSAGRKAAAELVTTQRQEALRLYREIFRSSKVFNKTHNPQGQNM